MPPNFSTSLLLVLLLSSSLLVVVVFVVSQLLLVVVGTFDSSVFIVVGTLVSISSFSLSLVIVGTLVTLLSEGVVESSVGDSLPPEVFSFSDIFSKLHLFLLKHTCKTIIAKLN